MEIPLARPDIGQSERDAVNAVLQTPILSLGPQVEAFERLVAEFVGARHAAAVNSGTSGLHLCLRALDIGPGDEVITTPFSFIASANCILFDEARPVFVDIDPETWNIDPRRVAEAVTPRTRALLPVDVFGQVADMEPLLALAKERDLVVIEDSCEALGARYRDRAAGTFGDTGVFGFYPNKQVTTGEGGMVVTDDDGIHQRIVSMRNQGREGMGWLAHARLGFNYRMSEINAAMGVAQMTRIEEILATRRRVADWYVERLGEEPRIQMMRVHADCRISWFVMVVRLNDDYSTQQRDALIEALRSRGIGCSNYFPPIHLQPFYVERFGYERGDFPVCEALSDRTIALPFHCELDEGQVDHVCRELRGLL